MTVQSALDDYYDKNRNSQLNHMVIQDSEHLINKVYIVSIDDGPISVFSQKTNALARIQEILNRSVYNPVQIDTYNWKYGKKLKEEIWLDKMVLQDLQHVTKKANSSIN